MKKIFLILIALTAAIAAQAADSAGSTLRRAASKIVDARTVSAAFSITTPQGVSAGKMWIDGNKFRYETPALTTVYNGATQWTVNPSDEEIMVYEPTADEIAQINPFAIISDYSSDYSARLVASDGSLRVVELTPRRAGSAIKNVRITINTSTQLPTKLVMTLDDNSIVEISISDIKLSPNIPASKFVVTPTAYPSYELIDLR